MQFKTNAKFSKTHLLPILRGVTMAGNEIPMHFGHYHLHSDVRGLLM